MEPGKPRKTKAELTNPKKGTPVNPPKSGYLLSIQSYRGQLPDPDSMAKYEQLSPGFTKAIQDSFVSENHHRRKMEQITYIATSILAGLGIISGLSAVISVLYVVYKGFELGHPASAASLGSAVIAAVAYVFVTGRNPKELKGKNVKNERE